MIRCLLIASVVCLFAVATPGHEGAEPEKVVAAELKMLEGEWRIVTAETGGQPVESKTVAKFAGAKCTLTDPGFPAVVNTVAIRPSKDPMWMDITNPVTKQTFLGIYKLDGDSLIATFQSEKAGRPTQFKTKKESGAVMYTYERIKAK